MKNISLQVEKMSCGNCLETVENALKEVSGVNEAKASLKDKTVSIQYDESMTDVPHLVKAVEDEGYIII
ncbi:heavy-metal-associated domain-containing protein [Halalkalibacter alkaliphilus]|uniref:Copper chaperone CopZ n=1 Tax=Halalkalibacter alkaliphilus TaxID=2917993 RepID=A0A9X2I825_9BACI|nr:heavy-metal-associated domain-containing protein [Halalkalibacter alkaliphilus]MCL7748629.1 cation transporter [Halalkalibacter alkaliphilus]